MNYNLNWYITNLISSHNSLWIKQVWILLQRTIINVRRNLKKMSVALICYLVSVLIWENCQSNYLGLFPLSFQLQISGSICYVWDILFESNRHRTRGCAKYSGHFFHVGVWNYVLRYVSLSKFLFSKHSVTTTWDKRTNIRPVSILCCWNIGRLTIFGHSTVVRSHYHIQYGRIHQRNHLFSWDVVNFDISGVGFYLLFKKKISF